MLDQQGQQQQQQQQQQHAMVVFTTHFLDILKQGLIPESCTVKYFRMAAMVVDEEPESAATTEASPTEMTLLYQVSAEEVPRLLCVTSTGSHSHARDHPSPFPGATGHLSEFACACGGKAG